MAKKGSFINYVNMTLKFFDPLRFVDPFSGNQDLFRVAFVFKSTPRRKYYSTPPLCLSTQFENGPTKRHRENEEEEEKSWSMSTTSVEAELERRKLQKKKALRRFRYIRGRQNLYTKILFFGKKNIISMTDLSFQFKFYNTRNFNGT